jgi:enoyl-CoA hydratase
MMMCDLVIASADAKFGEPEIRFSVSGPLFIMPWLIGMKRAKELLFFGDLIDAETARSYGMINREVPDSELDAATMDFARRLSLVGGEALSLTKAALNRGAEVAGLLNALSAGVNAVAPLYSDQTEVSKAFKAKVATDGVAAAVKWRNGQFRKSE